MTGFKQTTFQGYNNKELDKFYQNEYNLALKRGFTDQQAEEHAKFMVEFYGHQFRQYA
jgi:hypothetical protein